MKAIAVQFTIADPQKPDEDTKSLSSHMKRTKSMANDSHHVKFHFPKSDMRCRTASNSTTAQGNKRPAKAIPEKPSQREASNFTIRGNRPKSANNNLLHRAQDNDIAWNNSTSCPDRDYLNILMDCDISLVRSKWYPKPAVENDEPLSPTSKSAIDKLPLTTRHRYNAQTSGPILFNDESVLSVSEKLHDHRWNIQTKERDEPERLKPTSPTGKTHQAFEEFYNYEKLQKLSDRPNTVYKQRSLTSIN